MLETEVVFMQTCFCRMTVHSPDMAHWKSVRHQHWSRAPGDNWAAEWRELSEAIHTLWTLCNVSYLSHCSHTHTAEYYIPYLTETGVLFRRTPPFRPLVLERLVQRAEDGVCLSWYRQFWLRGRVSLWIGELSSRGLQSYVPWRVHRHHVKSATAWERDAENVLFTSTSTVGIFLYYDVA